MGASTPAIASAAATRWVDERRGCRIAMSPRVASHAFSAGFSPLYGKKKGASAPVGLAPAAGLVEWGATKNSLAGLWAKPAQPVDAIRRPGGISLNAHKKKRFRARGEGAPEPPVMRNTDATSLRQRYAEGVYSSGTQISGACYSGMTPSGRLWMRRRSLFLSFAADPARPRR